MLGKKVLDAIDSQITKEFYSAYLYLSMASYLEEESYSGLAKWMRIQAQEESCHAMIFFNYVIEQGHGVTLGAIDAPPPKFKSVHEVFEKALAHEKLVTASITKIMDVAVAEKDYATRALLDWFIKEQVEEEASASDVVAKLKRMGNEQKALYMVDKDLGARTFAVPSPLVGKL